MVGKQKAKAAKPERRSSQPKGMKLAVAGCVVFGAGVLVGALLGPLAKPKTQAARPETAAKQRPAAPAKASPSQETPQAPDKADPLTFFKTLKEPPAQTEQAYVPFKPAEEAPPPLESLPPSQVEAAVKAAEAPPAREEAPPGEQPPKAAPSYYVKVAAFQFGENAQRLAGELRQGGYTAFTVSSNAEGKRHQVKVGPYGSKREAASVAQSLQKRFLYPASVLEETRP